MRDRFGGGNEVGEAHPLVGYLDVVTLTQSPKNARNSAAGAGAVGCLRRLAGERGRAMADQMDAAACAICAQARQQAGLRE